MDLAPVPPDVLRCATLRSRWGPPAASTRLLQGGMCAEACDELELALRDAEATKSE